MGGNLHAQVAPGHHDAVGGRYNLVQVVHALLVLDFGDDADIVPAVLVELGPDVLHVAGLADEGGGDEVEVVFAGKFDVLPVLLGEGGEQDMYVGDVDGLVAGQGTAVLHLAVNLAALNLLHQQLDEPVVHQNPTAGLHLIVEVGVGDGDPVLIAGHVLGGEDELVPHVQGDGAVGEGLDADFGALGVQNGGHRGAQDVPGVAELLEHGQMAFVGAVGEVEPGGVHAAANQLDQHFLVVHRGAQGADDFCFTHTFHNVIPPLSKV